MSRVSTMISIRVPTEIKKEMDHISIKWAQRIREFIADVIRAEKNRRRWTAIDKLNRKHKRLPAGTCVRWIRDIRDNA